MVKNPDFVSGFLLFWIIDIMIVLCEYYLCMNFQNLGFGYSRTLKIWYDEQSPWG